MRPCSYYSTRDFLYILSPESPYYKRYFRVNRQYKLAPFDAEIERLYKKVKKLFNGAKKAYIKVVHLAKQRRIVLRRLRALSDREDQNILKLELDEMVDLETDKQIKNVSEGTFSEISNPFSPRFFFFFDPALLDFPDKTSTKPLSSR
jgi:hypothetical protein